MGYVRRASRSYVRAHSSENVPAWTMTSTPMAQSRMGTASAPTGVNTGVYFELRQNNKPVDPRSWLGKPR